jgi:hypothetical protein
MTAKYYVLQPAGEEIQAGKDQTCKANGLGWASTNTDFRGTIEQTEDAY